MAHKISTNFTWAEVEASRTAQILGIDNAVPDTLRPRMVKLIKKVMQPIRDEFGPTVITSGYRSPRLNAAIRGVPDSQHVQAEAIDFKIPGVSHREVVKWIRDNLDVDQCIYEFGESGWVHVSYRSPSRNRNEFLKAFKSNVRGRRKTVYRKFK